MYQELLLRFTELCKKIFQNNLVGVYLHGSAAMGCFHPETSDLDLIVLVENSLSDFEKSAFMKEVVLLNEDAPKKGLELSIVKQEFCKPFVYPTPFELHFSNAHLDWYKKAPQDYIQKMHGTDPDLAAHFTILGHCGIVLFGAEIKSVFGPVPRSDYIHSIWLDIAHAREDIEEDPVYVTLNLCRVLSYLQENLILSKAAGGRWAIQKLPEKYHGFLQAVLAHYSYEEKPPIDFTLARDFACDMLARITPYVGNCNP